MPAKQNKNDTKIDLPTAKGTDDILAQLKLGSLSIVEVFQCNSKNERTCQNKEAKAGPRQKSFT